MTILQKKTYTFTFHHTSAGSNTSFTTPHKACFDCGIGIKIEPKSTLQLFVRYYWQHQSVCEMCACVNAAMAVGVTKHHLYDTGYRWIQLRAAFFLAFGSRNSIRTNWFLVAFHLQMPLSFVENGNDRLWLLLGTVGRTALPWGKDCWLGWFTLFLPLSLAQVNVALIWDSELIGKVEEV